MMGVYRPKGVEIAKRIIGKCWMENKDYMVYYDPDPDGVFAGYIVERFIRQIGRKSMYYINENRGHGFLLPKEKWVELRGKTIVAVDFSMTREEIRELVSQGISIVSVDHHRIKEDFVYEKDEVTGAEGIIINNQYCAEPEEYRFLSGAGVVYYVLKDIKKAIGLQESEEEDKLLRAMVGITLLSDVRPTESVEAQEFLIETFQNTSRKMQYLVSLTEQDGYERFESFGVPSMNRNHVDFTFSPHINALFRMNKGGDVIKLLHEDPKAIEEYKINGRLRLYKDVQKGITEQIMQGLEGKEYSHLIAKGLSKDFKLNVTYKVTNFIGLTCSRVKGEYKTTFLYVEDEQGNIARGSVRGMSDNIDYLRIFREHGIKAEGHDNAFGVMETPLSTIDFESLNAAIRDAEDAEDKEVTMKVIETTNLGMWLQSTNRQVAWMNTLVRNSHRVYLKYVGNEVERKQRGKMVEYTIDGVKVKCFDLDLAFEDSVILPMFGKGEYIEFTIRRDPRS